MKFLKGLFQKPQPEPRTYKDDEELTEFELGLMSGADGKLKCPDCGSSLRGGPEGGGSQNCLCPTCYSEFNFYGFGCARISDKGKTSKDRLKLYGINRDW